MKVRTASGVKWKMFQTISVSVVVQSWLDVTREGETETVTELEEKLFLMNTTLAQMQKFNYTSYKTTAAGAAHLSKTVRWLERVLGAWNGVKFGWKLRFEGWDFTRIWRNFRSRARMILQVRDLVLFHCSTLFKSMSIIADFSPGSVRIVKQFTETHFSSFVIKHK